MIFIISLILGAVVVALVSSICVRFEESKKDMGVKVATAAILSVVLYAFAPKVPIWLAMVMLIVLLAMMGYLVWWWNDNGSTIREMVSFIILSFLLSLIGKSLAVRAYDWPLPRWSVGTISALPSVLFVMSIGFFIANRIWFRASLEEGGEQNDVETEA